MRFDVVRQVNPVHKLHRDENLAVVLEQFVALDDVFVMETGGMTGFAAEAFAHGRLGGHLGGEHLEGEVTAGFGIVGAKDGPHAARGNGIDHGILAQADGFRLPFYGRVGGHG